MEVQNEGGLPLTGNEGQKDVLPGAKDLRQRVLEATPVFDSAKKEVEGFDARVQAFVEDPTPSTFRSFFTPLLGTDDSFKHVRETKEAVKEIDASWVSHVMEDKEVNDFLINNLKVILPSSCAGLKYIIRQVEKRRNPLFRFREEDKITSNNGFKKIKEYLALYKQIAGGLVKNVNIMDSRINEKIDEGVERFGEVRKTGIPREKRREEKRSHLEEEVSSEGTLEFLEETWMEKFVTTPLNKMEAVVDKNGTIQNQADFVALKSDYMAHIRSKIFAEPRTKGEWKQAIEEWSEADDNFERQFRSLGLGDEYFNPSNLRILSDIRVLNDFDVPEEQTVDLRPRRAYATWAKLIDTFDPQTEWVFPELDDYANTSYHKKPYLDAIFEIYRDIQMRRSQEESAESIHFMPPEKLLTLPSFDRFTVLKEYLQNKDPALAQKPNAFEETLIKRLVDEVLIPGGKNEIEGGREAISKLGSLRSAKALEPLLYFQTLIGGRAEINVDAQVTMETILRNSSYEDIISLDSPKFVKGALLSLKDITEQPMIDEDDAYARSYLTAGLFARKFRDALTEIKANYDNPNYKKWATALLRGVKNSSQAASEETYKEAISLLDINPSLQHEILEMLAFRVHNGRQFNPDYSIALESVFRLIVKKDFVKSSENFAALYHVVESLQGPVEGDDYTPADLARIKLATKFGTIDDASTREKIEIVHRERDRLARFIDQFAEWMKYPDLPPEARYIALQVFDLTGYNYRNSAHEIDKLYQDVELAKKANENRESLLAGRYIGINFMRDNNAKDGYYECLTNLALRQYLYRGDIGCKDTIVKMFVAGKPAVRKGIADWFTHWDMDKYVEEKPEEMHALFRDFNAYVLGEDKEVANAVLHLFNENIRYRDNTYLRDLVIADVDGATKEQRSMLFVSLWQMVEGNKRFMGKEVPEDNPEKAKDILDGQETIAKVAEKMWLFIDSEDIKQQFCAVSALNLLGEKGEKFCETVNSLFSRRLKLENLVPGATDSLSKIKERINVDRFLS